MELAVGHLMMANLSTSVALGKGKQELSPWTPEILGMQLIDMTIHVHGTCYMWSSLKNSVLLFRVYIIILFNNNIALNIIQCKNEPEL